MAHKTMVDGTVYEIAGGRTMADGTAYGLTKGRTMTGGTGYDIPLSVGKALAKYAEGDIVYLPEDGTEVEFYVACHNYESGLNGSGRTLLVRKDCYNTRAWHSSNVNAWASCTLCSWLNSTYKALLGSDIQSLMSTTKYYYTPGRGTNSVKTRSDAVFLLSVTELGKTATYANTEGEALPIAGMLPFAYLNGSLMHQWTRSPYTTSNTHAYCLHTDDGEASYYSCTNTLGSRPAFTLPCTAKFDPETNVFLSA